MSSLHTILRLAFAVLLLALPGTLASAQSIPGQYEATVNGLTTTLTLAGDEDAITGTLTEGELRLDVTGMKTGGKVFLMIKNPYNGVVIATLSGPLTDEGLDATIRASGQAEARAMLRRKTAASARPSPAASPAPTPGADAGTRDARLVGTWVNEDIINSGGGGDFASFTTIMTMELTRDGKVRQYSESVGGGSYAYGSGRTLDFEGEWTSKDGQLLVRGMGITTFTPAARYEFSGEYLVTRNDTGRRIWSRR